MLIAAGLSRGCASAQATLELNALFDDTTGTANTALGHGAGEAATPASVLQQRVQEQQATNADLRARLARMETLMKSLVNRK